LRKGGRFRINHLTKENALQIYSRFYTGKPGGRLKELGTCKEASITLSKSEEYMLDFPD
jgi:hypothetical protein